MKKNTFIAFAFLAMLFSSCAAPNISYFNDMNHGQIEDAVKELDILLLPDDKISIVPALDLIRNKITGFCIGNLRRINRLFKKQACFLYDFCVNIIFICNFNILRALSCYKDRI